MNPNDYVNLLRQNYSLILSEFDYYLSLRKTDAMAQAYPKLVILYEFFRLLRGEGFNNRPNVGELQQEFYKMENDIKMKLDLIKNQLDPNDQRTKYYIEQMQKYFNLG